MNRVGIIGGGASGIMAAIAAARKGARVTILEKQDRIGKKILATGNGKCNLSNLSFSAERDYNSKNQERLSVFFEKFSVNDTVSFFEDCGLVLTEKNGYLYPRSGQASTVLNILMEQLDMLRVEVITECAVSQIKKTKKGAFGVETNHGSLEFDNLIISCGSAAGTREKDELGGMEFAKKLGIKTTDMLPALTALRCRGDFWKALAGVRCDGEITLLIKGAKNASRVIKERGEIQLTEYGISGIPTFQASRHASLALAKKEAVEAHLDFFPDVPRKQWRTFCEQRLQKSRGRNVTAFLEGMVNKKIAQVLLKEAGIKASEIITFPEAQNMWKALCLMRDFPVTVTDTNPAAKAQVCLGGVLLTGMDENLQVRENPGLYVTGELLDVDGRCGGYNLQWAWTSGYIAGTDAAGRKRNENTPQRRKI